MAERIRFITILCCLLMPAWTGISAQFSNTYYYMYMVPQANQLNPVVLYWEAVANKDAGNTAKALELAKRAANRNTLSPNLPFFRKEALQLVDDLGTT